MPDAAPTPTKPINVAALRGLLYGALAALVAGVVALTPADLGSFGWAVPILAILARMGEAALLDRNQPPQAGPLGGGPA